MEPLNLKVSNVFHRNWKASKRIVVNRGGTSSTKTYSICLLILNWLVTGRIDERRHFPTGTVSVVRKYGANLRTSVQKDFEEIIQTHGLFPAIEQNKTDRTYSYGGRKVEFIGIDDPQKARGPRRDILYCNEANELAPEDFFQLQIRTKYRVFLDFNPDDEDVWINTELEQRRSREEGDVEVIVSTFKDNPFLDASIRKEIERLSQRDPEYYRVYGLGQYGRLEGVIFDVKDLPEVPEGATLVGYGQDFGYTNDPSACVAVWKWNGALVLDEIFYRTGMLNRDIAQEYRNAGIRPHDEIFADSAEPKSIDELHSQGFNVKPVTKGPDSIKYGIDVMKQYDLYVTARSHNLRKEFKKYSWAKDKNGNSLNVPAGGWDHGIDGCRYLCMMKLGKKAEREISITIG